MTKFHAVMIDETGCEFGVSVEAATYDEARSMLREDYPESMCVQLESPKDRAGREKAMYDHLSRGGDYDDDGRPIYHYDYDDEDDDD